MYRILGATFHTAPAAPAPIPDNGSIAIEANRICKTDILRACTTADTLISHKHGNARHLGYLRADPCAHVGKHLPKATTWAAVADGEELVARPYIQPDAVQLVAAD